MHCTPPELRKYALLVVISLYFHEFFIMIVNMLFHQKPDDSGRNLITQTLPSCRNLIMTQT